MPGLKSIGQFTHATLALLESIENIQPRLICKRVVQFSCFGSIFPDSVGIPSCTSRMHDGPTGDYPDCVSF
jgi:hypothetical protein